MDGRFSSKVFERHALRLLIIAAFATGCAACRTERTEDFSRYFGDAPACFVLLEEGGGVQRISRFNPARCDERFAPCSTFKIPNSLIGLASGVIPDVDFVIPWDGRIRSRIALNRDHSLRTAIRDSVVWYYQELARRVGEEQMRRFIDDIGYGNRDLSAGLTEFWLGSSLKISANEQIAFLRRLRRKELPFSPQSQELVREILVLDQGPGFVYCGKTGSHRYQDFDLGWFVGWVERGNRTYAFAANQSGRETFGIRLREITERILRDRAILPAAR